MWMLSYFWFVLSCVQMNPPAENASEVFWTAPPQSTHSTELTDKLLQRWAEQIEAGVDVRGNHVDKEGKPLFINRLFLERSPYLQQHAHNPVDWRPWGEEALKEAQSQKKLIFLSVGYSTCHWCHVMEEESFEDLEIAAELNANYISIKVDREERPDLDALYMRAVQLMRGRGGWPMSLWLTPDGKPFLAATYIPARDGERGRAKGFLTLLKEVQTEYLIDPNAFFEDAEKLQEGVRRSLVPQPPQNIDVDSVLRRGEEQALQSYDAVFGGRSGSPKFPSSFPLPFLLQRAQKQPEKWREMISKTLLNMAKGGVYDHVGGGFHRYSVDARWQIPHFEKMLYDNALLAMVYLKAHRLYPQENWAAITKDILDYILRDMTSPEGGFYAATDADALGPSGEIEEGYFFSWTPDELEAVLPNHGQEVAKFFSVTARGNFEGRTVLQAQYPTAWWVEKSSINADHRETLRVARATRPPPLRDEKILVAWNGLMISAFSHAGFYLNQEKYRDASIRAGDFLWNKLRIDGVLHRSFAQGEAYNRGFSEDYALLIAAYLDIFAHTGEDRFWTRALELDSVLELEYEDPDGGWYRTSNKADPLLVREMPMRDGAEPSAASVAIQNILRFGEYTSDTRYKARFERAIARYGGRLTQAPLALDHMLLSLDWVVDSPKEVVLVAKDEKDAEGFLQVLRDHVPISMVLVQNYMNPESSLVPIAQNKGLRGGKATVYVCEGGVCQSPIIDPQNLPALLSIQQK